MTATNPLHPDPFTQLELWLEEAREKELSLPDAMTLATIHEDGGPDARMVLLRRISGDGLSFYTNYRSTKARQLDSNAGASLVLHWPALQRQVRVRGSVQRSAAEQSDAYWNSRPRGSQIAAHACAQSETIPDRGYLEQQFEQIELFYGDEPIPRPDHWGGFTLRPIQFEFWMARDSRLHDRFRYSPAAEGWTMELLAP